MIRRTGLNNVLVRIDHRNARNVRTVKYLQSAQQLSNKNEPIGIFSFLFPPLFFVSKAEEVEKEGEEEEGAEWEGKEVEVAVVALGKRGGQFVREEGKEEEDCPRENVRAYRLSKYEGTNVPFTLNRTQLPLFLYSANKVKL